MALFMAGLVFGGISGGGTYLGTGDGGLSLTVAAVVAFIVWLGGPLFVLMLDD